MINVANNGLKILSKPLLSTIKSSNRTIEIAGASFSDPGDMNQKLMNKAKKILNVINLR